MHAVPHRPAAQRQAPPLHRLLAACADAVAAVRAGRSLTDALAAAPPALRPGTQALAFAVLRRLGAAQHVRSEFVAQPLAPWVDALLLSALALLWPVDGPAAGDDAPRYAEHTLVDQAVAAARQRARAASGLVNAVLRRFVRERAEHTPRWLAADDVAYNHPPWWVARLRDDWPAQWRALIEAANRRAPMVLRVNARRGDAAGYVARLAARGIAAATLDAARPQAVVLAQPCPVQALPGFADGDVSVQDGAAQRAAALLLGEGAERLRPGARVLDACAAPGGKTAHLLELAELDLLALDHDKQRLARVADSLSRLGLSARLACADASRPSDWWDGRPFDAILLDAPCSGSGVVRRHPDIRWLRRPADIAALAATQAALLDALWPLLAPGGRLLYATCSVFRDEGQRQVDAFLQRTAHAGPWLDPASPGHLNGLPDNDRFTDGDDGFFYALLRCAPGCLPSAARALDPVT